LDEAQTVDGRLEVVREHEVEPLAAAVADELARTLH
jgi:hypothetical protein